MREARRGIGLAVEAREHVIAHARRDAPLECCGLLLGRGAEITEAVATRNTSHEPQRRYLIDPVEHLRVVRDARARGLRVLGAYHSHPRGPSEPSRTDTSEAFSDFVFVIVSLAPEMPSVSAWVFEAGNFIPVPLVRSSRG